MRYSFQAISWLTVLWTIVATADELPSSTKVQPVLLFTVPEFCEGVVFDHDGNGYISHGKTITQFNISGEHAIWAETGAPNGHKLLADGTHLVCDASQHAILHLSDDGKPMVPLSTECHGKLLRSPNDLTLDTAHAGFYFTDPGGSSLDNPIGTIHYVDKNGETHLVDQGLAFPNGIALRPDGKTLLVAESQKNRILVYNVKGPGKVSQRKLFARLPAKDANQGQVDNQPDGICLDQAGNLYVAHFGMQQVQVLNSDGQLVGHYQGGNLRTSNVAFGGSRMNRLFVTGSLKTGAGGLFRLDLNVNGLVILPAAP